MPLDAAALERLTREAGLAPASAVVVPLAGGAPAELDPWLALYPASTIKVPLAAAVLAQGWALDRSMTVGRENLTANDAESPMRDGYETTLGEVLDLAITRSDNVATNMLFDLAGRERAGDVVRGFGLDATAFHRKLSGSEPLIADPQWDGRSRNAHPAGDAARLLTAIARDGLPRASVLRAMLERQQWNDKLSTGLLPGDRFAHKTGDTDEVTHDAGILTTALGAAYVVVVYSGLPSTPEHNARFGAFMRGLRPLL